MPRGAKISLLLLLTAILSADTPDYMARGVDHFYNLEYDQAVTAFQNQRRLTPNDPNLYNRIASALLYKEMHRLGRLQSDPFTETNSFLEWEPPEPDLDLLREFEQYLYEGRRIAETTLKTNRDDPYSLYVLSQNYGVEASYLFAMKKAYLDALRRGVKARKFGDTLIRRHPDYVDGYLVVGVQEYVVGSLPWVFRALVAFGGIHGQKQKGLDYVERVVDSGDLSRNQARVLLTLLLRREKRPLEAAALLEDLIDDYPRNYIFPFELGAMYEDAGERDRALDVFRSLLAGVRDGKPGLERMPPRYRKALERKIAQLNEPL